MRKGLWDRHGVNNANCYEGIYGEKLLRRPKNDFLENSALFCSRFIRYVGSVRCCLNNHETCLKLSIKFSPCLRFIVKSTSRKSRNITKLRIS